MAKVIGSVERSGRALGTRKSWWATGGGQRRRLRGSWPGLGAGKPVSKRGFERMGAGRVAFMVEGSDPSPEPCQWSKKKPLRLAPEGKVDWTISFLAAPK